jgi:serine/threonine protein kinase
VGQLGGVLSSQGLDRRILVKEFTGTLALALAKAELASIGRLQSDLVSPIDEDAEKGEWIKTAASRSVSLRQDNAHLTTLIKLLNKTPYLGVLGEVNLAELEGAMEPNEFYRSLGVPPPKPDAVWIVYEYAGLSTLQAYSVPAAVRRASMPIKRGFFGPVEPPKLPPWRERANYVVNGIMKGAILAVATMHESGIAHRSIGRSSIILSAKTMDKREASSPFTTMISQLQVKLADFGFSGLYERSTDDEEFRARARSFGLSFREGENSVVTANFAVAEDMHALGFVFLGLLLSSLAELPTPEYSMPATDEDTLQRLLGEIFDKDFDQFREYVEAEEIWSNLVELLDENDGAGWKVLETLVLAREKAAEKKDSFQMFTIRGLLSNPFFSK